MSPRSFDPAVVEAEVNRVRSLGIAALRARWRFMFGGSPPAGLSKDIIKRLMAYRIQEDAFGGLDRETKKLSEATVATTSRIPDLSSRSFSLPSRALRFWAGMTLAWSTTRPVSGGNWSACATPTPSNNRRMARYKAEQAP